MKRLLCILVITIATLSAWAVPARPTPLDMVQPNGDTITVRLHGDEWFHFYTTIDGYLIAKNDKGYYCYAVWEEYTDENGKEHRRAVAKRRVAKNEADRSRYEKRWLVRKKIDKR